MSSSVNVRSIEALKELKTALQRFSGDAQEALNTAQTEIQRTTDWLQERLNHWQNEVRRRQMEADQAKAALAHCQASGYQDKDGVYHPPNCGAYENALRQAQARLQEAEAELHNVQRLNQSIHQAVSSYQRQAQRLAALSIDNLSKATAVLDRSITALESYVAMASPAAHITSGLTSSGVTDAAGTWEKQGLQDVPLNQINLYDSYVHSAEDFQHGVSYTEMAEGLHKLEDIVRPAVQNGADADYFSRLDSEKGLDYSNGYRKVYDVFYGDSTPIRLVKIGDEYTVDHGHHRLFAARDLGLKAIPAVVTVWNPLESGILAPATPPEFREGNIGGPERRG